MAKTPDGIPTLLEDHITEIRSGVHLAADVHGFIKTTVGLGLRYSRFNTSHSIFPIQIEDDMGNIVIGELKDDIKVHYIGPSLMYRSNPSINGSFGYFGYSLGALVYDNRARIIEDFRIQGQAFGISIFSGFDIALNENVALGMEVSLVSGSLGKIKITDNFGHSESIKLDNENRESLARFDIGAGLRS